MTEPTQPRSAGMFGGLRLALQERPGASAYLLAAGSVVLASLVVIVFGLNIRGTIIPLFFAAVVFSAWRGGFWPGLFAMLLSILIVNQFLMRLNVTNSYQALSILMFAALSILISSLSASQRYTTSLLLQEQQQLERRVEDRTQEVSALSIQFQDLFENAPISYHEIDGDGRICRVNRTECELLQRPKEDLMGRPVWDLVALEQRETSRIEVKRKLSGEKTLVPITRSYERPDGTLLSFEIHESLILSRQGEITGIRSAMLDITARLQAEEALRTLNAQLEDRVLKRTEELQRSNDDLQQFAYSVSHDLQEPLRMVRSYTKLLDKRYNAQFDADGREFLHFIVDGAERMSRMIQDLLAFSRASHVSTDETDEYSMSDVVAESLRNLRSAIEETDATIEIGSLPDLIGRPRDFIPVWQNLIGNALKYRSERAPFISINAERQGSEWTFCVADNGLGFDAKFADRIFGVFQRLHGKQYAGTGIGLAICRRIVERNGGRMWATSEVGVGSKFCFTLPIATEPTLQSA